MKYALAAVVLALILWLLLGPASRGPVQGEPAVAVATPKATPHDISRALKSPTDRAKRAVDAVHERNKTEEF